MVSAEDSPGPSRPRPIMTELKKQTAAYHAALESLPYFKALIDHRLPLECYVHQLRALSVIHGVFESEIPASQDQMLSAVWNDGLRKLPLIEEDLSFFEPRIIAESGSPIDAALSMAKKIRLRRVENPATLLGYLYVLEGSTLGNRMHLPDISATFHLDEPNGCRYYASYGGRVKDHWRSFSDQVNAAADAPDLYDPVVEAAHEAFSGLKALYSALYPLEPSKAPPHVTRINPEAGNHPMPRDRREISAALDASSRVWTEFPYYRQRYGERGKRFSDSDSCWLVTLTALEPEAVQAQVQWLCRVLASRGMPSILMEKTLLNLSEELTRAIPDNAAAYQKLKTAADGLQKQRIRWIPENAFQSLSDRFDKAVGAEAAKASQNTGMLLAAAVADEKNGINGAVDALAGWLTDPDRFPGQWIRAVDDTVENARRLVQ